MKLISLLKILLPTLILTTSAAADEYQELKKPEIEALISGHTMELRSFHPMQLVFHKDGTFRVSHHTPCAGGEKSTYEVDRYGQLKIVFRNCDGKKRSYLQYRVFKKGKLYFVRDQGNTGTYKFIRKK
ncbi:hypothetical protein [Roseibium suaedae]|uniref:Uncharacterized protein n=1 Tax=Roseibium suaedae TaxID=735517 RepID=A0A1M7KYJ7_9HYPH|nr:hypothetical protein [Roseibium suaedae]SHM70692.1 hypothetical protein SAMN05444272_3018 [Roseibium suaedae]